MVSKDGRRTSEDEGLETSEMPIRSKTSEINIVPIREQHMLPCPTQSLQPNVSHKNKSVNKNTAMDVNTLSVDLRLHARRRREGNKPLRWGNLLFVDG